MMKRYKYFLLTMFCWSLTTVCNASNSATERVIDIIPEWLYLTMFCCLGAFVLHCKLRSDNQPFIEFIHPFFPKWESPTRAILDALLFAVIGGLISYGLIQPTTTAQALSAGLSWTGLLSALSQPKGEIK